MQLGIIHMWFLSILWNFLLEKIFATLLHHTTHYNAKKLKQKIKFYCRQAVQDFIKQYLQLNIRKKFKSTLMGFKINYTQPTIGLRGKFTFNLFYFTSQPRKHPKKSLKRWHKEVIIINWAPMSLLDKTWAIKKILSD